MSLGQGLDRQYGILVAVQPAQESDPQRIAGLASDRPPGNGDAVGNELDARGREPLVQQGVLDLGRYRQVAGRSSEHRLHEPSIRRPLPGPGAVVGHHKGDPQLGRRPPARDGAGVQVGMEDAGLDPRCVALHHRVQAAVLPPRHPPGQRPHHHRTRIQVEGPLSSVQDVDLVAGLHKLPGQQGKVALRSSDLEVVDEHQHPVPPRGRNGS